MNEGLHGLKLLCELNLLGYKAMLDKDIARERKKHNYLIYPQHMYLVFNINLYN